MKKIRFITLALAISALTMAAAPVIADHHELSKDRIVNKHDFEKGKVVSNRETLRFDDHHSKSSEQVVLKKNSLTYSQYHVTNKAEAQ